MTGCFRLIYVSITHVEEFELKRGFLKFLSPATFGSDDREDGGRVTIVINWTCDTFKNGKLQSTSVHLDFEPSPILDEDDNEISTLSPDGLVKYFKWRRECVGEDGEFRKVYCQYGQKLFLLPGSTEVNRQLLLDLVPYDGSMVTDILKNEDKNMPLTFTEAANDPRMLYVAAQEGGSVIRELMDYLSSETLEELALVAVRFDPCSFDQLPSCNQTFYNANVAVSSFEGKGVPRTLRCLDEENVWGEWFTAEKRLVCLNAMMHNGRWLKLVPVPLRTFAIELAALEGAPVVLPECQLLHPGNINEYRQWVYSYYMELFANCVVKDIMHCKNDRKTLESYIKRNTQYAWQTRLLSETWRLMYDFERVNKTYNVEEWCDGTEIGEQRKKLALCFDNFFAVHKSMGGTPLRIQESGVRACQKRKREDNDAGRVAALKADVPQCPPGVARALCQISAPQL